MLRYTVMRAAVQRWSYALVGLVCLCLFNLIFLAHPIPQDKHAVISSLSTQTPSATSTQVHVPPPLPETPEPQQVSQKTAVVIACFNRPDYLTRTLNSLFSLSIPKDFQVFVSQDGNHPGVSRVISNFANTKGLEHLVFQYDQGSWVSKDPAYIPGQFDVYYRIAAHYFFFLHELFSVRRFDKVIIIEDDMELAPDFFSYFSTMGDLLDRDPSLFCISAWNDNGREGLVSDSKQVYRSDFFPGLGWMLTSKFWDKIDHKWTAAFWDDWLRDPQQTSGLQCLFPEVNRVYTFGSEGSSQGQYFNKYLATIQLNKENIDWSRIDKEYLYSDQYDAWISALIDSAIQIPRDNVFGLSDGRGEYRIKYDGTESQFKEIASKFSLMEDFRGGKPRASYNGIVSFRHRGNRIWIVKD